MKYFLSLFMLIIPVLYISAQDACCLSGSPAMHFAALGENENFRAQHELPIPFTLSDPQGHMMEFETVGPDGGAYYIPAKEESDKYLFVIHEWWGLNDYIKREAERLHEKLGENVHVIALDLYDGKVAETREQASEYVKSVSEERARQIIKGAIDYAGNKAKFASVGWCFGGGWSLETALLAEGQAIACVIYYGMPVKDVERLKSLHAEVLGLFAEQDDWITVDDVEEFRHAMHEAGKEVEIEIYPANHAFANPSGERYNEEAAQKANARAINFLKSEFSSY